MSLIQIALVLGSILLLVFYSKFLRSTLRDRTVALILCLIAVTAILFPGFTTVIANLLGVGRGTDLLIYIFVLGVAFVFVVLNGRIMSLEENITQIVRELALLSQTNRHDQGKKDGNKGSASQIENQ